MSRLITHRMITASLVDTTAILKTDTMEGMTLLVNYTRGGVSTGDLTVYGAMDADASIKYAIGIAPTLTGSRDADGAVSYTTSTTVLYEIPGVHPYIYLNWNEGTDGATITIDLNGVETA